ncbi:MAG: alanyl-tRNA editing protein [Gaiellales bacterium]
MTDRLYYRDSYLREFEASVVDLADEGRRVYLDRTAFYPTSGGQPFDTGVLGDVAVVDVVDEGERIAHLVAAPLDEGRVTGRLDWDRRFDHMQQHTGQHLLSAVLAKSHEYRTVSVHFGRESSTLDLDISAISPEQVVAAEARANAVVMENRRVELAVEDADSAAGLRKASDRQGPLRIVTIQGLDRSACGGTHVRATGEIGPILVRKVERVRKIVRFEFLCGRRAVRRARADFDLLSRVAGLFSATAEEVPGLVEIQRTELKEAGAARRELEEAVSEYRARELYDSTAPTHSGMRLVLLREEAGPAQRLRGLAQALAAMPNAVLLATVRNPPAVLVAASADSGIDAGQVLRAALERVGGRGGGSARLAQGTVGDAAALEPVVEAIRAGRCG